MSDETPIPVLPSALRAALIDAYRWGQRREGAGLGALGFAPDEATVCDNILARLTAAAPQSVQAAAEAWARTWLDESSPSTTARRDLGAQYGWTEYWRQILPDRIWAQYQAAFYAAYDRLLAAPGSAGEETGQ